MLHWKLRVQLPVPNAAVKYGVPVEGSALMDGGVEVHVVLRVNNGQLARLEIFRIDGAALGQPPAPEAITVLVPAPLDAWASAVLGKLLAPTYPGVEALRVQAASVEGRNLDTGTGLMVYLYVAESNGIATVATRVPVEGRALDLDGTEIQVLLHVMNGRLHMIEAYRIDSTPLSRLPVPASLQVEINSAE
jgi:hypothetical protein